MYIYIYSYRVLASTSANIFHSTRPCYMPHDTAVVVLSATLFQAILCFEYAHHFQYFCK